MADTRPVEPDFRSTSFLRGHVAGLVDYYYPRCIDERGGYFHIYALDGSIADRDRKPLVSSARMVAMFCMAARMLDREDLRSAAWHGFAFLNDHHRNPETGGYRAEMLWRGGRFVASDPTNQAYGLVHVGLALAHAVAAGLEDARPRLAELYEVLDRKVTDPGTPLYKEEFSSTFRPLSPYRGQNANMHAAEAWLQAFVATREERYLARARDIAEALCLQSTSRSRGLVYEHFDAEWHPDFAYNRGDFSNIYRPWGFQPGHQTEWAKLLVALGAHSGELRLTHKAEELFRRTIELAWDQEEGGLYYGLAPDLSVCNQDKYFWPQIESAVAAARLSSAFKDDSYLTWYDRFWRVCWEHFVDHRDGSWDRTLSRDFRPKAPDKGLGGKDYHIFGACYELLKLRTDDSSDSPPESDHD